ncbi:RusA family crossover junction endodeoxyribonuclease [Bacteroides ovatus]|nr:RusA family crossover junction endodeoxyribonuclease [Bacteroides ovatus]
MREYEKSFCLQCKKYRGKRISGRFKLFIRVWHGNIRFDLDNALKTILDCLQMVEAITNDSLCFEIHAEKRIDRRNPRVEFGMEEINEQKNIFSPNKTNHTIFTC